MGIVCLGDSLSAFPDAWPSLFDDAAVVAVVGARIGHLAAQIADAPDAQTAVVTIGTNDALQLGQPLDLALLPDEISMLRERYRRVFFLDVILFLPYHPPRYWPELSSRRGHVRSALHATRVETLRPRLGPLCWRRDGIHPNARGHRCIATAVQGML